MNQPSLVELENKLQESKAHGYDLIAQQEAIAREISRNNDIILSLLSQIEDLNKVSLSPNAKNHQ